MQPEIIAALIGVGGVVLGSVISYQLGKRQSVDQDLHARRVEATTAVRSKIYDISTGFENWENVTTSADELAVRRDFVRKLDDLANYYQSNKPWLPEEIRPIIEACLDDVSRFTQVVDPS